MNVGRKVERMENKNLACRIFKEQIDLVMQLPENERGEVLYKAVLASLNQIENQIEIQNENAYVSVSVSDSVSVLSKTVFSLLQKNIVWKEFSNNYGGKRPGAGKKKQTEPEKTEKKPTVKEIIEKIGCRHKNQIQIDENFTLPNNEYFNAYKKEFPAETQMVENWIRKKFIGRLVDFQWIGKQVQEFRKRKTGKIL